MDFFTHARRLERRIARTFDGAAQRAIGPVERDPLEVIHAVVEAVERQVQPAGRGRRVFPYNSVTVTLAAASPAERARYEALLEAGPALRERVLDGLRAAGAGTADVDVTILYAATPEPGWAATDFHVEFARVTPAVEMLVPHAAAFPRIQLTILSGSAARADYTFAQARIDVGRGADVRDTRTRLLRTNHVAFAEGAGEVNNSVSRRHAHLTCDRAGDYRLHDDGSAHGTSVLRNGATVPVRTGSRGVRLRDGDEIVLGEARVRVNVAEGRPRRSGP